MRRGSFEERDVDDCLQYVYHTYMAVTWDALKAAANLRKHGIRFTEALAVPFDPVAVTIDEVEDDGETRLVMVGADIVGRVVVVVLVHRGQDVRLISARRATGQERRHYEEGI